MVCTSRLTDNCGKTMRKLLIVGILVCVLSACANQSDNLYQQLGGKPVIAQIVDNFISEIEFNQQMFAFFKDTDVDRFREKLNEHLCLLADGPCQYTGDPMDEVHAGMQISEADFNLGVDLFIAAMTKAGVPHPMQNKLLARMVPTRKEIIYL